MIAQEARDDQEDEFVKILERTLAKIAKEEFKEEIFSSMTIMNSNTEKQTFGRFPKD